MPRLARVVWPRECCVTDKQSRAEAGVLAVVRERAMLVHHCGWAQSNRCQQDGERVDSCNYPSPWWSLWPVVDGRWRPLNASAFHQIGLSVVKWTCVEWTLLTLSWVLMCFKWGLLIKTTDILAKSVFICFLIWSPLTGCSFVVMYSIPLTLW